MTQPEQPCRPRRSGVEGRTSTRFRCRERLFVRFAVKPTFRNIVALVHDVSVNGIGFLIDQPLEAGNLLVMQIRGGSQGLSTVRTAKVMHVRKHLPVPDAPWVKKKPFLKSLLTFFAGTEQQPGPEFIYLVGCRFSPPLSPEEMDRLCGTPVE